MVDSPFMTNLLEPYQPQLPLNELVVQVNRLYHAFEAQNYDGRHPEVYKQLPHFWQEMIKTTREQKKSTTKWHVLDFGCGTGFAAQQLIRNLPHGSIAELTCYDPAPEMIEQCRSRIVPFFPKARFCCNLKEILDGIEQYNLLATNSVLHHLPDFINTINSLLPILSSDAVWLSGHTASRRFYKNIECVRMYNEFLQERKLKKFFSPANYLCRLKHTLNLEIDPAKAAAKESLRKGLFKKEPTKFVIGRLVDFHVAHSFNEAVSGRGLDFESMQTDFTSWWNLSWVKTYSFMGAFYEDNVSEKWVCSSRELADKFPQDGANFCAIWRRA